MRRVWKVIGVIVLLLAGVFVAIPMVGQHRLDTELAEAQQLLRDFYGKRAALETADRHWFGRETIMRMSLSDLVPNDEIDLPAILVTMSSVLGPVTVQSECGVYVGTMSSYTTVTLDPPPKGFRSLAGGAPLLSGCSRMAFSGRQEGAMALTPIDGEIAEGKRLRIPGLVVDFVKAPDGRYTTGINAPEAVFEADDGTLRVSGITGTGERSSLTDVLPDDSRATLHVDEISLDTPGREGGIEGLALETAGLLEGGFYRLSMEVSVARARLGGHQVTGARYAIGFRHLDPEGLATFYARNMRGRGRELGNPETALLLGEARAAFMQLLAASPELQLEELGFEIDGKQFTLDAGARFDGDGFVSPEETPVLPRLSGQLNIRLSADLLRQAVKTALRPRIVAQFEAEAPDRKPDETVLQQEIDRQAVRFIDNMKSYGFIEVSEDGRFVESTISVKDRNVRVNGRINPTLTQMLQNAGNSPGRPG